MTEVTVALGSQDAQAQAARADGALCCMHEPLTLFVGVSGPQMPTTR